MKKIRIVINCDEGFVADTLRDIATLYEDELDTTKWYETDHGCGFMEEGEWEV